MVAVKRKQPPSTAAYTKEALKRNRIVPQEPLRRIDPTSDIEAATDSDPIIESDTGEESGEDDGVSWPSDDEYETSPIPAEGSRPEQTSGRVNKPVAQHKHDGPPNGSPDRTDGPKNSSTSSKEAHAKQKVVAQERKAAKPNADQIARAKKLWERLRIQSKVPREERKELVAELFGIITGRVKDLVLKHDSGRVIQTALKYGNREQRKMIAQELKGEYRVLAESRYAKFMIGKLLVHGDEEIRDMVVPEFYGNVRRMIKHPEAAWILDDVYRGAATPKQKAILLREWYGAEFAIFRSESSNSDSDLKAILSLHPEKRTPIMRSLFELINQLVQKKTVAFTMLHDAMLQYYRNVLPGSSEALEFIELLKSDEEGDLLKNLAFTRSGSRLVCLALAHSSAKDRKAILRTYKNTIQTLVFDNNGHQVLLTAYEVIDDTVLTAKSIFSEFPSPTKESPNPSTTLSDYITHITARIPLLYLFVTKPSSLLPPEDLALLSEIHEVRKDTSKKDPQVRRIELVRSLSPPLLTHISTHTATLIQTPFGCQFITEVILSSIGADDLRRQALSAVADLALSCAPETVKVALQTPAASRMLKTLVLGGRFDQKAKRVIPAEPPLEFHHMLYERIGKELLEWMTGPNAFVVVGLVESEGFMKKELVFDVIRANRTRLEMAVNEGEGSKVVEAGRKGTRLLLEMVQ